MTVGRCSLPPIGVGVPAMPDAGLGTPLCVQSVCEVTPGVSGLRLLVPATAVGVFMELRCLPDGVEPMASVISATQEFIIKDVGMEF